MNINLIKNLTNAFGPSGFEDEVRAIVRAEIVDHVDSVETDAMGNLIAHKKGRGQKVMIAAHLDEIGVMATHITDDGFVRFTNVGGVYRLTLRGNRVRFANGTIGTIMGDRRTDMTKTASMDGYFIDVGATSLADCPVYVGDAAKFDRELVEQNGRLISPCLDDRIGCYVLIEVIKQLKKSPLDIYFVFSVQEEVGVRGATAAANLIQPDIGLAVDVTLTGDTPASGTMTVELGGGPAIKVKDTGMIASPAIVAAMRDCGERHDIPTQDEILVGGSTDARAIQVSGTGSAAGALSIPCRNVHTQSEIVDIGDVEESIELLVKFLGKKIKI